MAASLRHWIVVTFVLAVLLLAFVGTAAYRTTTQLIEANNRAMRSHDLVERLTYLRLLLDDAETGSRGYALTGREEYLEPYNGAVAQLDTTLQILRHDLADNADALPAFEELRELIKRRLQVSRELVTARRRGMNEAMQVVSSGRGKEIMDKARARITALQIQEQNLLLKEDRETRDSARRATWAVLIASGLGVMVLVAATAVISRSIRQRELAEAALRRSESMQRAILDGTNHAILSTDVQGSITSVNATGLSWLGYESPELVGQSICKLHEAHELRTRAGELSRSMGVAVSDGFEALSAKAWRGIAEERNWTYVHKNGSRIPVRVSMTALRDSSGSVSGYVLIVTDLREQLAVERMKDEFISIVSHELRTPLTSIKGALGLLASGVLQRTPERAGRMVQIASENTDRLMRLVNDILDLERMQSGQFKMDKSLAGAAELMQQAADSVRVAADSAGVTLQLQTCDAQVHVDPARLVQSFINLLGNAIKFSLPGGTVTFAAAIMGSDIVFSVADEGRGIPADKLEHIFERFQQVDISDSREKGGTGLGLAITRMIVQQHGGEVWAESELGHGSTFRIRLPLPAMAASAQG